MNRVERLLLNYKHFVALPWDRTLAGAQKAGWLCTTGPRSAASARR